MESKVSEGGLNVTLTIRLLMHGKVMWAEVGRKQGTGICSVILCRLQSYYCTRIPNDVSVQTTLPRATQDW